MWLVPILLGLGCAVTLWVAARSRDDDVQVLAFLLSAMLVIAISLWFIDRLEYLPALDWIVGVLALVISISREEKWPRIFVMIITLRLTLHLVDYLTAHRYLVQYIHGLNALFALLLMVVSYAGSGNARADLLGHLHRLGDWLHAAFRATAPRLIP